MLQYTKTRDNITTKRKHSIFKFIIDLPTGLLFTVGGGEGMQDKASDGAGLCGDGRACIVKREIVLRPRINQCEARRQRPGMVGLELADVARPEDSGQGWSGWRQLARRSCCEPCSYSKNTGTDIATLQPMLTMFAFSWQFDSRRKDTAISRHV